MRRLGLVLVTMVVLGANAIAAPQADVVEVKSSLAGIVLADDLVEMGVRVEDAQPLVYVRTALTGLKSVAARAPREGVVREVLVRPGQRVERGDVVVRLLPR
ncbi:MAG: biotin attachment protein [Armatimonadetes bacterium]|nr:biotin attachment protein [Armatimonadota bacterium]